MTFWKKFRNHKLGYFAFLVILAFCFMGIYAPFFASSKPFMLEYDGHLYFPMFRYLLYRGFYTKRLDLFFNLLIFTVPMFLVALGLLKGKLRQIASLAIVLGQCLAFIYVAFFPIRDPAADPQLTKERIEALKKQTKPSWNFDLQYLTQYAKLNMLIKYYHMKEQHKELEPYLSLYEKEMHQAAPTLWQVENDNYKAAIKNYEDKLSAEKPDSEDYELTQAKLTYTQDRRKWLEQESAKITWLIQPPLSHFHWEDDAGGQQALNQYLPWWDLTRINRKDLLSALIFGIRISLVVGILAVSLALLIGIPIGSIAGYFGGNYDIIVSRLLEIWEAMPTFFMLLLTVAILQSKSIFLVISIIGLFGWPQFSRYIRGEFFKQRNLPYVEACHSLGFKNSYIMFKHILPNAIPPILTLLPFAIMGAITSEAALSFLGLGEEGSCSWGVLMDEGRTAFPQESYLMWPPAILLTTLLIAIALVGDSMRDILDPKLQK